MQCSWIVAWVGGLALLHRAPGEQRASGAQLLVTEKTQSRYRDISLLRYVYVVLLAPCRNLRSYLAQSSLGHLWPRLFFRSRDHLNLFRRSLATYSYLSFRSCFTIIRTARQTGLPGCREYPIWPRCPLARRCSFGRSSSGAL